MSTKAPKGKGKAVNVPDKRHSEYILKKEDKIAKLESFGQTLEPAQRGSDLYEAWYSLRSPYTEKRKVHLKKASGAAGGKEPK